MPPTRRKAARVSTRPQSPSYPVSIWTKDPPLPRYYQMAATAIRIAMFGYSETCSIKKLSMRIPDSAIAVASLLSHPSLTVFEICAALRKSRENFELEHGKIVACDEANRLVHAVMFKLGLAQLPAEKGVVLSAVRTMLRRANVVPGIHMSDLYLRVFEPSPSPTTSV
ncbi:hypothetical protein FRC07_009541 [Ceratobasidium sp. 392]|nr:hypothetical protein FRC07_009541 [Ceratobasidium sp. 392]